MAVKVAVLKNKEVLVGVTGSIAAYRAADLVSSLTKAGAKVTVIMTKAACAFITPLTLQTLSHQQVFTDLFETNQDFDPQHISLVERADVLVIAPATANIIGKITAGIADDFISTVVMAMKKPVLIAPAMNENMWQNPIVQKNITTLKKLGYKFINPEKGPLACRKEGEGRLAPVERIIDEIINILTRH